MVDTIEQLAEAALRLDAASRAELAERLVASLNSAETDEIQRAWAAEAVRRRDEVRTGRVLPIPADEVIAEARSLVGRAGCQGG